MVVTLVTYAFESGSCFRLHPQLTTRGFSSRGASPVWRRNHGETSQKFVVYFVLASRNKRSEKLPGTLFFHLWAAPESFKLLPQRVAVEINRVAEERTRI